jgi:hypothetical protein
MFCPECGKPLVVASGSALESAPQPVAETPAVETTSSVATEAQAFSTTPMIETAAASPAVEPDKTNPSQEDPDSEPGSKPGARERARERLHRAGSAATSVARHALDDNVKRVEKIHHVSTAIYEEAAYDPSLRFVLVALGLFIVFVILLVLSKVMG